LAEEYEGRVEALQTVTKEAVVLLSRHIQAGGRVLDAGCGVGLSVKLLGEKGYVVTGIDISPKMAEYARARNPEADIIVGDFLEVHFDQKFDGIFAFAFIHLFPKQDAERVLQKMHDILALGGVLYIGTTESRESKEGWEEKKDYIKGERRFRKQWTEKEFEDALRDAGFQKLEVHKIRDPYGKTWMDFIMRKI